jgi:hemerythrin
VGKGGASMAIQWNNVYKIGNPEIDAEHQEIFRRANALLDVADIAEMTEYAIGFFNLPAITSAMKKV